MWAILGSAYLATAGVSPNAARLLEEIAVVAPVSGVAICGNWDTSWTRGDRLATSSAPGAASLAGGRVSRIRPPHMDAGLAQAGLPLPRCRPAATRGGGPPDASPRLPPTGRSPRMTAPAPRHRLRASRQSEGSRRQFWTCLLGSSGSALRLSSCRVWAWLLVR